MTACLPVCYSAFVASWSPRTDLPNQTPGVTAYSVHPGIVKTNLQSTDQSMMGSLMRFTMKLAPATTALDGAMNSLFCATSPRAPAVGQGRYFVPVAKLDSVADTWLNDKETNARLWEESAKRLEQVV